MVEAKILKTEICIKIVKIDRGITDHEYAAWYGFNNTKILSILMEFDSSPVLPISMRPFYTLQVNSFLFVWYSDPL